MKPNIAFCGFQGSGKTTAANYLEKYYGYKKIAFGDAVKVRLFDILWTARWNVENHDILRSLYLDALDFPAPTNGTISEDREECSQEKIEWVNANKPWLRLALQKIGTEYYRGKDPDYWIKKLEISYIYQSLLNNYPLVLDDLRFRNEAEWLKERGFTLVHVIRKGHDGGQHSSEELEWIQDINPIKLYNPDSLEMLHNDIQQIIYRYEN